MRWVLVIVGCLIAGQVEAAPRQNLLKQMDAEFLKLNLGIKSLIIPKGFLGKDDNKVAPHISAETYIKPFLSDDFGEVGFLSVSYINKYLASKAQFFRTSSKQKCAEVSIYIVEKAMNEGVVGWKKHWREDYQVALWRTTLDDITHATTCRFQDGDWYLEVNQTLNMKSEKYRYVLLK